MTNREVVKAFFNGRCAKTTILRSNGIQLENYSTVLAARENGVVYVNLTRYSPTTSKIQSYIRSEMPYHSKIVDGCPFGVKFLANYEVK